MSWKSITVVGIRVVVIVAPSSVVSFVVNVLDLGDGLLGSRLLLGSGGLGHFDIKLFVTVGFLLYLVLLGSLEALDELFGWVEDAKRLPAAHKAPLRLAVVFEGTGLAEIMLTPAF